MRQRIHPDPLEHEYTIRDATLWANFSIPTANPGVSSRGGAEKYQRFTRTRGQRR